MEYYAHPRNRFWPLMGRICGAGPDLPYAERLTRLKDSGIGLWDVLHECVRAGSLDAAIERGSEVPNDFAGLLSRFSRINTIALNGKKAALVFRRLVLPGLIAPHLERLTVLELPSTSPANASKNLTALHESWGVIAPG
jgi:hypoxanthine-DNA glycosylase